MQEEPSVDAEMPDAGFSGNYTGSQGASTGILGIMEVILGDFQRTIKETAIKEAIDILSHFYGAAAKAFLQVGREEPSVDAEMPDAGFSGNYTGSQGASTG